MSWAALRGFVLVEVSRYIINFVSHLWQMLVQQALISTLSILIALSDTYLLCNITPISPNFRGVIIMYRKIARPLQL